MAGFLLLPRSQVTQANVDRIRPGMGLREVEAILGGPGEPAPACWRGWSCPPSTRSSSPRCGNGRGGREATVSLDGDGVVLGAVHIDRREGWLPWELRRFLGLGARDTFLHG